MDKVLNRKLFRQKALDTYGTKIVTKAAVGKLAMGGGGILSVSQERLAEKNKQLEKFLDKLKETLSSKIAEDPGFLLEDSYRNMLSWINKPSDKNLEQTLDRLKEIDTRRNLNSKKVFKELYGL